MWLRANIVLVVAVLFALVQMFASATTTSRRETPSTVMSTIAHNLPGSSVAKADNGGEDNGSNDNDSADNSSADNSDSSDNSSADNSSADNSDSSDNSSDDNSDSSDNSSDDNSGSDNSDNGGDEDNSDNGSSDSGDNGDSSADADVVIDNVEPSAAGTGATNAAPAVTPTTATSASSAASAPSVAAAPATTAATTPPSSSSIANAANALPPGSSAAAAPSPVASPAAQPVSQVSATTSGVDTPLSLNNGRVTVQLFAALPTGLTVTLRMVDPLAYPPTPGIRAGDLIFQIEAKDATGATLTTLPSEVNITVHYNDPDVVGLTEANITMGHLDEATSQWTAEPKLVADAAGNTVSASTTNVGVFSVYVP